MTGIQFDDWKYIVEKRVVVVLCSCFNSVFFNNCKPYW